MLAKLRRLRHFLRRMEHLAAVGDVPRRGDYKHPKVLLGTQLARQNLMRDDVRTLQDVEFQVFSQFGDDGILQYLVHKLAITDRTFVEFGVEDYTESNTRFLLVKDKWSGLVLDASAEHVGAICRDPVAMYFNVRALHALVTAENINELLRDAGMQGPIGVLSIDIDGMDYWVWRAITAVEPAIVVIEYNASFGATATVTVPYRADFDRSRAHPTRLYYGSSLGALRALAREKGYAFLGCNGNGNNAYFLRNDLADLTWIEALQATYQPASFAEHAIDGHRVRGAEINAILAGLPVFNPASGQVEPWAPESP